MKIAFVLDDGLDKPDGVQQYIRTLGDWFTANGHEVRYLVGETKRTDIDGVHSLAKNIKVRFNGNALSIPLPTSYKKIRRVLAAEQFDVIHVQVPYSPFMGALVIAAAAPGTKVVGTFHILPYGWASRWGTRMLGLVLRHNMKRFDAVVSVSEPAQAFARTFGMNTDILPNSVNMAVYKPHAVIKKDKTFSILFLGRLVERKGCHQFIEAMYQMKQRGYLSSSIKVDIAGDGPQRNMLARLVKEYELDSTITFHGFVSLEQKVALMQRADLSIFPSLSGESFGIVLIEAMAAAGGVVLAGNNPGYASVLGPIEDSIIEPRKPSEVAEIIHELIQDKKKYNRIYKAQQAHVRQFDTPVVARRLLDYYKGNA